LQSFLAGNLGTNNGQVFLGDPRRHISGQAYAAFFQDDWRVTPRLIVNLGLRYEYQTPISEANNLLANWTPTDGFLQLGVNANRMWNADKNNFAPRLGFAWDIAGNGKTVLRGGGTVIYVTPTWWEFLSQQNQNDPVTGLGTNPTGFQICTPTVASGNCKPGPGTIAASGLSLSPAQVNWNQNPALYAGSIYPSSSDTSQLKCGNDKLCTVQATNENLRSAYVMQWSLGIQRSITNNLSISVDYVGNRADKLLGLEYTNTPRIGAGWTGATGGTRAWEAAASSALASRCLTARRRAWDRRAARALPGDRRSNSRGHMPHNTHICPTSTPSRIHSSPITTACRSR